MIRYLVPKTSASQSDRTALRKIVETEKPGWLTRAGARTSRFKRNKKYSGSSIWGEISDAIMRLQSNKCAFCERLIRSVGGELEHFRPKGSISIWPPKSWEQTKTERFNTIQDHFNQMGIQSTGPQSDTGYYMLAYEVLNYAIACHECNGILKRYTFPIAKQRHTAQDRQVGPYNQTEKPLLIYPIGKVDQDPETLIAFLGTTPLPIHQNAQDYDYQRAMITILFFNLDQDSTLLEERAEAIMLLYMYLENQDDWMVESFISGKGKHTNCCRSFKRMYDQDPDFAHQIYQKAKAYYQSKNQ